MHMGQNPIQGKSKNGLPSFDLFLFEPYGQGSHIISDQSRIAVVGGLRIGLSRRGRLSFSVNAVASRWKFDATQGTHPHIKRDYEGVPRSPQDVPQHECHEVRTTSRDDSEQPKDGQQCVEEVEQDRRPHVAQEIEDLIVVSMGKNNMMHTTHMLLLHNAVLQENKNDTSQIIIRHSCDEYFIVVHVVKNCNHFNMVIDCPVKCKLVLHHIVLHGRLWFRTSTDNVYPWY